MMMSQYGKSAESVGGDAGRLAIEYDGLQMTGECTLLAPSTALSVKTDEREGG